MRSLSDDLYFSNLVQASGKMCILDILLGRLLSDGHKVLVFTFVIPQPIHICYVHQVIIFFQMTSMLTIVQGHLQRLGIGCFRLDGDTKRCMQYINCHVNNNGPLPTVVLTLFC